MSRLARVLGEANNLFAAPLESLAPPVKKVVRMVRKRVSFIGRVQGVGFRATSREIARGFAVAGWVRNEPDGSVTLEVQGEPLEIAAYLDRLRSTMSRSIRSETLAEAPVEKGQTFEIRF
jgi:acylphosphatase